MEVTLIGDLLISVRTLRMIDMAMEGIKKRKVPSVARLNRA